jgi:hypothetical protein
VMLCETLVCNIAIALCASEIWNLSQKPVSMIDPIKKKIFKKYIFLYIGQGGVKIRYNEETYEFYGQCGTQMLHNWRDHNELAT